ncbi:sirtuin 6 [Aphomia sociella]
MSCNYAEGLSPYEHKGILGIPEKFDPIDKFNNKCELLAQLINNSKHVVVHTGAGISTSAGIPDFRGPNGVWTLEKEGKRPTTNVSFADAKPTKTHMILKKLVEYSKVHYIVSQNIDGLHLKSGLSRKYLAELHGNMFVDECNVCKRQFVRSCPVETVGKKCSGVPCAAEHVGGRPCRGRLYDGVLDWEHSLPENDLQMAEWHSSIADLSICLGTTLQIIPSGNLPLETVKYGGQLVICNLQPTKHDNKADLVINYYVDDILERVMNILSIDIPIYNEADNLTKQAESCIIDWTLQRKDVLALEAMFKAKCKGVKKKKILIKNKRNSTEVITENSADNKSKVIKLEIKEPETHDITIKNEVKIEAIESITQNEQSCSNVVVVQS